MQWNEPEVRYKKKFKFHLKFKIIIRLLNRLLSEHIMSSNLNSDIVLLADKLVVSDKNDLAEWEQLAFNLILNKLFDHIGNVRPKILAVVDYEDQFSSKIDKMTIKHQLIQVYFKIITQEITRRKIFKRKEDRVRVKHSLRDLEIKIYNSVTSFLLPPEVLLHVFSFFNQRDYFSTRVVCRDWYKLLQDKQFQHFIPERDYEKGGKKTKMRLSNIVCLEALSEDYLVIGTKSGELKVIDSKTRQCKLILSGHNEAIAHIFVLSEYKIMSGSYDGLLKIWDIRTGECEKILSFYDQYNDRLSNGDIVSNTCDDFKKILDERSGKYKLILESKYPLRKVQLENIMLKGPQSSSWKIWSLEGNRITCRGRTLVSRSEWVRHVAKMPNGNIVCGMAYGFLVIWNPDLDQCKIFYVAEGISCLAISPDNNIVTGSDEGLLQLLDHRTGECRAVFKGHSKKINCIATLSNGDLASGSDDGTLRLWDSKTGKCKYILNGRFSRVTCIAALTDDKVAMGADSYYRDNRYDDVLKIWDINTGKCLYTLQGHGSAITFIYSLYNGTILVGSNNKVLIWNINTGECKQIIEFDEYIKSATQLSSGNLLCLGRKNLWIWHFPLTKLQQVDEAAKNNLQP